MNTHLHSIHYTSNAHIYNRCSLRTATFLVYCLAWLLRHKEGVAKWQIRNTIRTIQMNKRIELELTNEKEKKIYRTHWTLNKRNISKRIAIDRHGGESYTFTLSSMCVHTVHGIGHIIMIWLCLCEFFNCQPSNRMSI